MQLPREILVGSGVIKDIPEVTSSLRVGKRVLIVTGPTKTKEIGEAVIEEFSNSDYSVELTTVKNSTMEDVLEIKEILEEYDFSIAVGGGKVIDVVKLGSFKARKEFMSVPTAASNDGMASFKASIKGERIFSLDAHAPLAVVADTSVMMNSPFELLASGCGDLVSNLTAVRDWRLAYLLRNEPYSEYAAALSEMSAEIILDSAEIISRRVEESYRKVVKSLISSGVAMSIAGSSRPASGSEHLFSHALDEILDEPARHGEQCGVGSIMMMYLHGGDWKRIRDTLKKIGAPTNAKELGVPEDKIIEALTIAHKIRPERYTILGDRGLTWEAAERLAIETEVISP